jgi:hypothetical protein
MEQRSLFDEHDVAAMRASYEAELALLRARLRAAEGRVATLVAQRNDFAVQVIRTRRAEALGLRALAEAIENTRIAP